MDNGQVTRNTYDYVETICSDYSFEERKEGTVLSKVSEALECAVLTILAILKLPISRLKAGIQYMASSCNFSFNLQR